MGIIDSTRWYTSSPSWEPELFSRAALVNEFIEPETECFALKEDDEKQQKKDKE